MKDNSAIDAIRPAGEIPRRFFRAAGLKARSRANIMVLAFSIPILLAIG